MQITTPVLRVGMTSALIARIELTGETVTEACKALDYTEAETVELERLFSPEEVAELTTWFLPQR